LAYFPARTATAALTAFGLLAVMLAITGIYGLGAYTVSRRVREIGVRVAVGAQPWQMLRSVMGRTGKLLLVGGSAGLAMGWRPLACWPASSTKPRRAIPWS